ncbi:MAG: Holliday junction resolvase RuvX [Candidatus Dormibacteraceae bacterium]
MPSRGRIVAIDPGTRRIGLAVSDPSGSIAQPLETVMVEPEATVVERLRVRIKELGASEVVIGLPYRMDGSSGPEVYSAKSLASLLRAATGLRVTMVDERLTTVAAERAMRGSGTRSARRRELSDQVAAALILQTHLGRRH